jgi:hypothetical protein
VLAVRSQMDTERYKPRAEGLPEMQIPILEYSEAQAKTKRGINISDWGDAYRSWQATSTAPKEKPKWRENR